MEPVHIASKRKARAQAAERRRFAFFLYFGACIAFVIAVFAVLQYGPFLKVQAITVGELPGRISEGEVVALVRDTLDERTLPRIFGMDNIISWPRRARIIELDVPSIRELSVKRSLFARTIALTALPRERFGIWCSEEPETQCFWFDDTDGLLIEETPVPEGQIIPAIFEVPGKALTLGKQVLRSDELVRVRQIISFFSKSAHSVQRFEVHPPLEEMHVFIDGGPRVKLSLRFDEAAPLSALAEFFETHAPETLSIVDLTVEQKLYWTVK